MPTPSEHPNALLPKIPPVIRRIDATTNPSPQLQTPPIKKNRVATIIGYATLIGISSAILLLIISAVIQHRWAAKQHWVNIETEKPITSATLTVSGVSYPVTATDIHDINRVRYDITAPSDFRLDGTFSDGTRFSGRCGTVTRSTPAGIVTVIVNADGTLTFSDAVGP